MALFCLLCSCAVSLCADSALDASLCPPITQQSAQKATQSTPMTRGNQRDQDRIKAQKAAAAKKDPHSAEDLKKMEAAKSAVQCKECMQGFMSSVRAPELQRHIDAKHPKSTKTFAEIFPDYKEKGF